MAERVTTAPNQDMLAVPCDATAGAGRARVAVPARLWPGGGGLCHSRGEETARPGPMVHLTLDQALARAETCLRSGRPEEARQVLNAILRAHPGEARARRTLALLDRTAPRRSAPAQEVERVAALCQNGRFEAAVTEAERLLQQNPSSFALLSLLGGACLKTGRIARAEDAFRRALAITPDHAGTRYNLGLLLQQAGRLDEALAAYREALARDPRHADARNNLGNVLSALDRHEEAAEAYRMALAGRPDWPDALANLGRALRDLDQPAAAMECWRRALDLAPGHAAARLQKLRLQWESCDFTAYAEFDGVRDSLGITGAAVPPFALLAAEDDPARQRQRSATWAGRFATKAAPPPARAAPREGRPRIGYFCGNFHDHATLRLTAGLFRAHDRSRFEVFAYALDRHKTGALRAELERDVEHFHDVEHLPAAKIAELARSHALDIAIDLDGYTRGSRPEIFAARPAGITIGYLGYPGTSAADFVDYLVADPLVIPEAERTHYSESVIFLPGTYQPTDDRREVPDLGDSRADHGLPEDGFVFCCFNNSYKIGPAEFDIWMRLLRRVKGSVLWLLQANAPMVENLRREAGARGVDPGRLVFAPKAPQDVHLARHRHADLFLDTFRYNAHTTASDALWAGLPLVTMAGRQFAARVGASVLRAAGLPELITTSAKDYEALCLDLARRPGRLAELRARLAEQRATAPLFDTRGYTRTFEAALDEVLHLHRRGEPPRDIHLSEGV
ncbi:tetratricopeptide repeat protein [Aquicoccus sp. SCR17]|nr:tetratricopeptide repeat protein [Carideicomes alvinocaridis]